MAVDEQLKRRINNLIKEQLYLPEDLELKPEDSLANDLGADDLAEIETVMSLEEEFGITISEKDEQELKTMQSIYDYIDRRMNS